ncbi:hypothetical protein APHAL10511_004583 [Amanita phalloides]|nr:hypothetical protein APHAL10511_004583 [Amanita phalloides]
MTDLAADLDLHIRLRQRIAPVLHARLHWALLLQQSLRNNDSHTNHRTFQSAANDAITSIESQCNILFDYPLSVPPRADPRHGRLAPRLKHGSPRISPPNFLYIRSSALDSTKDEDEFCLLRCPQCLRTTFTTLQGLLNHARIAHRLEWGTHEECVRACAVLEPNLDMGAGAEVGLGPAGILPGLRSIFQMAVGPQMNLSSTYSLDGAKFQQPNHLTKLLGLHEDTPALAPFLGKSPLRRGIKVDEPDDIIDINSFEYPGARSRWRSPLSSRNTQGTQDWVHDPHEDVTLVRATKEDDMKYLPAIDHRSTRINTFLNSTSRFHFNTRIIVTDRSHWILPDHREEPYQDHSHKWMISIHSPSYACDLTTILKCLTVTSVRTDVAVSTSIVEAPPYVVIESDPLMSHTQRIVLEHWVELDLLKTAKPVVGEEQTIDIELDKRTLITPAQTSYVAIGSKALWEIKPMKESSQSSASSQDENTTSEYTQILNHLVSLFPMTKAGRFLDVPYKLAQAHSQLRALNMGRRKAIEWRRAIALREAYTLAIAGRNDEDQFPILSVGDCYVWLVENGHFFRPSSITHKTPPSEDSVSDGTRKYEYCQLCGSTKDIHSSQSGLEEHLCQCRCNCGSAELQSIQPRRFPFVDVRDMITVNTTPLTYVSGCDTSHASYG